MIPKKQSSLGGLLKNRDFKKLVDTLHQLQKDDELKDFQKYEDGLPNDLDNLLLNLPKFIYKLDKETDTKILHEGAEELIDTLLQYGANPNASFNNSVTPFMLACELPDTTLVKKMLNSPVHPANLEQGDGKGNRPLFYATMAEATEIMDYLVKECKVNVDFQYILSHQQTVFHYACGQAKEKSIEKLIELGANPQLRDNYENYPGDMIPAYDEDIHEEGEISPEEIELWDNLFEKVKAYTNYKKETQPVSKKKVF